MDNETGCELKGTLDGSFEAGIGYERHRVLTEIKLLNITDHRLLKLITLVIDLPTMERPENG
jgi:hypothetical protein